VATALAVGVLMTGRRVLAHVDGHEPAERSQDEADILTLADA
jgi:hypothetical protein